MAPGTCAGWVVDLLDAKLQKGKGTKKGITTYEMTRWDCGNCVIVLYGNPGDILQIEITVGEMKPLLIRMLMFSPRI